MPPSHPCSAAHPRTGGENEADPYSDETLSGSSPHGRGKRDRPTPGAEELRLIPARAGKTESVNNPNSRMWAHPRTGGENAERRRGGELLGGSSPHGRGKPRRHDARSAPFGLIPARAGKTTRRRRRCRPGPAHPRTGGENPMRFGKTDIITGSSPHGRGKHFLTCAFIERIGQILETLELAVSSGSYSLCDVYATDAPRDPARSIGLVPLSNRDASSESVLRSRRASRDLPTSGKRGPARCAHDRPSRHVLSSCSP